MKKAIAAASAALIVFFAAGCGNTSSLSKMEKLLRSMTVEEKVWQMLFVAPEDIIDIETAVQAGEATKKAVMECPAGGIIYFSKNIESRRQISEMISNTQSYSKIPLFIGVDEEGGRVSRLADAGVIDKLPPMAEIGAMGYDGAQNAFDTGSYLGGELSQIGFNMNFAPVADIITDDGNEDIGDRSFSKSPYIAAELVSAEVKGMQEQNVSAVLKHFPGNGSTAANTHYETGLCVRTPEEMRGCEFIPFKAGIDAGADAVMAAHMAAVNLTGDETPSSLSEIVIRDYLRGELGFDGLVITDALNMGAITNMYSPADAAEKAINAGADILLMVPDVKNTADILINKVRNEEISMERIDESVERILRIKEKRGLL